VGDFVEHHGHTGKCHYILNRTGQAYTDGMRLCNTIWLPLAMIVVCIVFVPVFHKLKLFAAYSVRKRFDLKP
jgi:hypothetical protein